MQRERERQNDGLNSVSSCMWQHSSVALCQVLGGTAPMCDTTPVGIQPPVSGADMAAALASEEMLFAVVVVST